MATELVKPTSTATKPAFTMIDVRLARRRGGRVCDPMRSKGFKSTNAVSPDAASPTQSHTNMAPPLEVVDHTISRARARSDVKGPIRGFTGFTSGSHKVTQIRARYAPDTRMDTHRFAPDSHRFAPDTRIDTHRYAQIRAGYAQIRAQFTRGTAL